MYFTATMYVAPGMTPDTAIAPWPGELSEPCAIRLQAASYNYTWPFWTPNSGKPATLAPCRILTVNDAEGATILL